jgi:hypothetical protein
MSEEPQRQHEKTCSDATLTKFFINHHLHHAIFF